MKIISSISSWTIGQTDLIIAFVISYLLGSFILDFSVLGAIMALIVFLFAFIFLANPKIIIYFVLFMVIFGRALSGYTWTSLGGLYYNLTLTGLVMKGVIIPAGILLLLSRKIRIFGHKLSAPAIFFVVALGVGIIFSPYKLYSLRFWNTYVVGALLYFIVLEYFKDRKQTKTLFKLILFLSIPSIIVGMKQLFVYQAKYRIVGLYQGSAAPLAMLCVVLLLLTIFLFFEMRHKWIYITIFTSALILLFYTYSRSSWLSFFVAMFIAGRISRRHRKILLVSLIACLIAFLALSGFRTGIAGRLKIDDAALARIQMSRYGWELFKKSPIWGVGPGNYGIKSAELLTGEGEPSGYGFTVGSAPHNEYARYIAEGGILGITAYLFLLYSALKLSVQVFKSSDLYVKNYGVLLISLVTVIIISSMTDNSSMFYQTYFWIFLAIGENYLRELRVPPQHI